VTHVSDGPGASTYPNGCHVAEVEVDPQTGFVEIVKYSCVNDFGTLVNPMIVEGQMHGGVVQGIGQALMEQAVYDEEGQLLTGSFMDYAMPRAADVPSFALADHGVPTKTNPLGVKGCGAADGTRMIPKSGNRFPACAKPRHRLVDSFDASAGEGRSGKIVRQQNKSSHPQ
jgi:carbon-monoxide dehydrogenase large subunit